MTTPTPEACGIAGAATHHAAPRPIIHPPGPYLDHSPRHDWSDLAHVEGLISGEVRGEINTLDMLRGLRAALLKIQEREEGK